MKKILLSLLVVLFGFSILAQSPVKIWTGIHEVATPYTSPTATSVDFLPDGRILSAGYNGLVKLWDTNGNFTIIYQSEYINGIRSAINSISTDGDKISIGQNNGLVKVINGSDWNIGVSVLRVAVNNGNVAAVGMTNNVYINGQILFQTSNGSWNYGVSLGDKIFFGGTDKLIYSSFQPAIFCGDWVLDIDYRNNIYVECGLSEYLFSNDRIVYIFQEKGNSCVSINSLNNKVLVGNYKPAIYLFNSDFTVDKVFSETSLIRDIQWSPDGSRFAYCTADGRIVYALPEYSSNTTSTNSTVIPKKKGRK